MNNQLIKNTALGTLRVYPKTYTEGITDKSTGKKLAEILSSFNMYFLSYTGNTTQTRCQVPKDLRREGLWITYVDFNHKVITEWYNSDNIDDDTFGSDTYWRQGSNKLIGDISISSNGNWVIDGKETEFKATGDPIKPLLRVNFSTNKLQVSYDEGNKYDNLGDNPVYTLFRTLDNKLQVSTDLGTTWENCSEPIAAWFRWADTSGTGNVGKVLISRDNKTWSDLSPTITNNLYIKGYVSTVGDLPTSSAAIGDIYMVGPTYDESDTTHDYPHYRMWVKLSSGWVDNGEFTNAGPVSTANIIDEAVTINKLSTDIQTGIIYDVSAHNNSVVFESLSALLSSSNLSTLIPTSVRHGGMSIRFIQGSEQSSDNKYVQYRLMSDTFNTTPANWQGVDDEPTAESNNLVKSGGVAKLYDEINYKIEGIISIKSFNKFNSCYIKSDGSIITNADTFSYYVISNVNFKSISVVCSASSVMSAIAFYSSDTISSNNLISSVVGSGFAYTEPYIAVVPQNCQLIVVSTHEPNVPIVNLIGAEGCNSAKGTSFDNTNTNFEAENVQDALQELDGASMAIENEIKSIDYEINGAEANIGDFAKVINEYIKDNGDITIDDNFDYYVINNFDFKNISVVCGASSVMSAIAFYNSEEIGANTLISNIIGAGFASTTPYTATVPVGCKTIVVSNRKNVEITASLSGEKGLVGKFVPLVSSRNLIDKNASGVLIGYYIAGATIDGGGTYEGNTTDYIPVLPSMQYSFYTGYENGAMRFITYYDSEKNVISHEQNAVVITTPASASYVRITIINLYWNNCSFGVGVLGNVTIHKSVVNQQNIEIVPSNGYVHFVGTLLQNRTETLLPVHLGYGYNATLLISNVFDTIRFGFGESEYNGGFVEINATEIKVYSYYSALDLVQTYEHGLTIGERTYIQLIKDRENSTKIILCSMGNSFETSLVWNPSGTLFVHYLTGNPIAYKVGYCPTMINKSIWVFGDSYYGNNPNRFVGYLFDNNQNDWLINNKPGIASPASLIDLKTLLSLNGKPKYVLWGLGMNDPQDTDEDTPNPIWLQCVQEVIGLCEDNGVIPILATIPSALAENVMPNVLYYHDAKSKWVRNSGYRYIDFAASVGAQADGTWYPGCKHTDIHPSIMGAKMMYEQCLVDFPEIASKGF